MSVRRFCACRNRNLPTPLSFLLEVDLVHGALHTDTQGTQRQLLHKRGQARRSSEGCAGTRRQQVGGRAFPFAPPWLARRSSWRWRWSQRTPQALASPM